MAALIKNPRLVAQNEKGETSMPTLQLLQEEQENFAMTVAELHSLKEVVKGAGAFAMRELNPDQVESLACTDPQFWPPISVTRTNGGYILYDGQHRLAAAKLLKLDSIRATCKEFQDINSLIEAAFRANLRHGLPASKETRGDYCYWLNITFPNLSQRQIAARVGISQSAVSQAIERRKKLLEEAVQGTNKEQTANQEDDNDEWRGGVVKRVKTFIRSVSRFSDTEKESESYSELVREIQLELLQIPEDRQALQFAGQLLLDAAKSKARKVKT